MAKTAEKEEENQWCFACGRRNPIGLKLQFRERGDVYQSSFVPGREHQGYDGMVHGGIISTLLDEITAGYIYAKGIKAVTARLEVRFRQPTPIGVVLTIEGKIVAQRGRLYETAGTVKLPDGSVTAEAKATIMATGEVKR